MEDALTDQDVRFLQQAGRLAMRGHGGAEPNPIVGCIVTAPGGRVVGWGYHRRCGERHAERIALDMAGRAASGATVYVTLEPCDHTGRTGPCSEHMIACGVRRVVIARRDPNPIAAGGGARLRHAGIEVRFLDDREQSTRVPDVVSVSDPFVHRVRTGLPWVIAKWAQTIDGRIATRQRMSRWISSERSRRMVHRQRGRVDAILTGIGTLRADDPQLTARDVRRRRIARRVVIDPALQTPIDCALVQTIDDAPAVIVARTDAVEARPDHAAALREKGVDVLRFDPHDGELPLSTILRDLAGRYDVSTVLVEAGPGLLSRLFQNRLVNAAWVFTAPIIFGDPRAVSSVHGRRVEEVTAGIQMHLRWLGRRGDDVVAWYDATGG